MDGVVKTIQLLWVTFDTCAALDPTWPAPAGQASKLSKYLQDIVTLTQQKGKLKALNTDTDGEISFFISD